MDDREMREEAARLHKAVWLAKQAKADHSAIVVDNGEGMGECVRCEISGVPILEMDEVVEDPETGEVWLRSAVGLPPRAVIEDEDEDDELVEEEIDF